MRKVWLLTIALLAQALTGPVGASAPSVGDHAHCPQMTQVADSAAHDCCTDTGCAAEAGCVTLCQGNIGPALLSLTRSHAAFATERFRSFRTTAPALAAHSLPLNRPPIALQS